MGYEIGSQTTATAIGASLTTLLNWTAVDGYSDFHLITENTGGGSGNDITDVQLDQSDDGGVTVSTDAKDVTPAAAIVSGVSDHVPFTPTTSYIRIRATCTTAEDTTAKCWVTADSLSIEVGTYALTTLDKVKDYLGITVTTFDEILNRLINDATASIETYCNRQFAARAYTMERYDGSGVKILQIRNYPIISVERIATLIDDAMSIIASSAGGYSATAEITRSEGELPANTQLKLVIRGTNASSDTVDFSTYTNLADLATQINTITGWTASANTGFTTFDSTELIQHGARECLDTALALTVPHDRLDAYEVDYKGGEIYRSIGFGHGWRNIYVNYNGGYTTIPADLEQIAIEIVSDVYGSRTVNNALKSEKIGDYSYTLSDGSSGGSMDTAVTRRASDLAQWRRFVYG